MRSLLFIFTVLCFCSCQKDLSIDNFNTTPLGDTTSAHPVLLTKLIIKDTTDPVRVGIVFNYSISYDALHRPDRIENLLLDNNGDSSEYDVFRYYYNGLDTFAYKLMQTVKEFNPVTVNADTTFLTFSNGSCTKDSLANLSGKVVNSYTYLGGTIKIIRKEDKYAPNFISNGAATVYQTKSNDDITYQVDTLVEIRSSPGFPNNQHFTKKEYFTSYLQTANPFYKVYLPVKKDFFEHELWLPNGNITCRSLISQQEQNIADWAAGTIGVNINYRNIYSYTFRPDGYPLQAILKSFQNGIAGDIYSITYVYNR